MLGFHAKFPKIVLNFLLNSSRFQIPPFFLWSKVWRQRLQACGKQGIADSGGIHHPFGVKDCQGVSIVNFLVGSSAVSIAAVHPHMRGVNVLLLLDAVVLLGSPPPAWG